MPQAVPQKAVVGAAPISSCPRIALSAGLCRLHAQRRAQHKGFLVKHSEFSMVVAQGRTLSVPGLWQQPLSIELLTLVGDH